jgi:hypothetical protein
MRIVSGVLFAVCLTAMAGCSTRSISNSGFPEDRPNWAYRGEVQEADLIVPAAGPIAEQEIVDQLAVRQPVVPQRGNLLMVIQSGALQPDSAMLDALGRDFRLVPVSGVPGESDQIGRRLRLMAAEGGVGQILCYWGELEAGRSGEAGKAVSWLPIVGSIVPDETQHMRIVLRAVLLDVATGRWRMFTPPPVDDERLSASIGRRSSDQSQVERLKHEGYASLARSLVEAAG